MSTVYKINPSLISKVAFRPLRLIIIIFIFILLYFSFIEVQLYHKQNNDINGIYLTLIIQVVLLGLILFYSFRRRKRIYQNLEIIVSDEGIQKSINYQTFGEVTFIDRFIINKANQLTPLYKNLLRWEEITAIDEKPHNLYIKTNGSNNFYGTGQIVVPKEIEQYEEIKKVVVNHLNKNVSQP